MFTPKVHKEESGDEYLGMSFGKTLMDAISSANPDEDLIFEEYRAEIVDVSFVCTHPAGYVKWEKGPINEYRIIWRATTKLDKEKL